MALKDFGLETLPKAAAEQKWVGERRRAQPATEAALCPPERPTAATVIVLKFPPLLTLCTQVFDSGVYGEKRGGVPPRYV